MTETNNRPGLRELRYRLGTFGSFREQMLRRLAAQPALAGLTARQSDDYGVALLEATAYVADILTFYQERYVQEAYLGTAGHRDSLTRLGALLAYRPRPGLAAETYAAFTAGGGKSVDLPAGLRLQSAPGPGEEPRKYETMEPMTAHPALNRLRIYPKPGYSGSQNPYKAGGAGGTLAPDYSPARLRTGQRLLLVNQSSTVAEKRITGLTADGARTVLTFEPPMDSTWSFADTQAFTWRRQLRLFGHQAPPTYLATEPDSSGSVRLVSRTTNYRRQGKEIHLDALYEDLRAGTPLLILHRKVEATGEVWQALQATVAAAVPAPAAIGAADSTPFSAATVTRISLNTAVDLNVNAAVIYELEEPVRFWGTAYPGSIAAGSTSFQLPVAEWTATEAEARAMLRLGRRLLLADQAGAPEAVTVTGLEPGATALTVYFTPALSRPLATATAVLYGNVARATHGQSVGPEVLGSGDPNQPWQRYTLKKAPVAFVRDPEQGTVSSLSVQVDGIRWHEAPSFLGQGPEARVYVTEVGGDGSVTIIFGDGITGARLPRGTNNVVAWYRQGGGTTGAVRPGTLVSLLDRPRGLEAVSNPAPPIPGTDPEGAGDLRARIPAAISAFDRAVSLRDFETMALSFGGVAKASAAWIWNGARQVLHLTVAGANGAPVDQDGLRRFLDSRRDIHQLLHLAGYRAVPILAAVRIQPLPDHDPAAVAAAVREALVRYFAFDTSDFGQTVYRSDLYRAVQAVPGVAALVVDRLCYKEGATQGPEGQNQAALTIGRARFDAATGRMLPAELAVLADPDTDIVVVRREQL